MADILDFHKKRESVKQTQSQPHAVRVTREISKEDVEAAKAFSEDLSKIIDHHVRKSKTTSTLSAMLHEMAAEMAALTWAVGTEANVFDLVAVTNKQQVTMISDYIRNQKG